MAEDHEQKGIVGQVWNHLKDRAKAVVPEVMDTLTNKVIPQGAAELSQAINMGHGYVPYGAAQQPLDTQGLDAPAYHAPVQDTVHGKSRYETMLADYAARAPQSEHQQERGMGMER